MTEITVTDTLVKATNAQTVTAQGVAYEAITAGQALYADATNGYKLRPAINNNSAAKAAVAGIALDNAAADQPVSYAVSGDVTFGNAPFDTSEAYVLADTAGKIGKTDELGSGKYATFIGVSTSTSNLRLGITAAGVAR